MKVSSEIAAYFRRIGKRGGLRGKVADKQAAAKASWTPEARAKRIERRKQAVEK